ncbi:hypothetical protein GCM10011297_12690 [Bacterioplanes sanyensis]|uniref:DNA replication terminus site-binding protein n=1 Tax=Bacterioplanes sanyensis TaxID=1249553 RepID=UPI00167780DF|nr:DNA replication terminus site-binding protein [Bacterioplanes sanyensis]GGY41146.1 hypothetical protein GCM10011297_12690 [Bacterioplanes sanyensis]
MIQDIVAHYDQLISDLQCLCRSLQQHPPRHWLLGHEPDQALGTICQALQDVWYQQGQDGRVTRTDIGLMAVSPAQFEHCQQVNDSKQALQHSVRQYRQQQQTDWPALQGQLAQRHSQLREHLKGTGLARLHLKQCYRQLPLLPQKPKKVGFSWYAHGRSIKQLTIQQAEEQLLALGEHKTHIQMQLQTLGNLRPGTRLAQVQDLAPIMRANLLYPDGERKAMSVSLPLIFIDDGSGLPAFNQITPEPPSGRTRQSRGDRRLSDELLLPSLRVYGYQ